MSKGRGMKKLLLGITLALLASAVVVQAQEPDKTVKDRSTIVTNAVPDWQSGYQEELAREYIRRRAQERSAARQARIEGMKWLGHSPSRPLVSATPFMSSPPTWVGVAPAPYWGWPRVGYTP
jgi:hypothetical protein